MGLAGVGVAHFAAPGQFDRITASAFPRNTRKFTFINGGLETGLGIGLAVEQTRRVALVGMLGYGAYLAANIIRNR